MAVLRYLSHPQVQIDPDVPVPDWGLSGPGRGRLMMLGRPAWLAQTGRILSSTERKARDTALILGSAIGVAPEYRAELGEIDRRATGYVPPERHEELADACFANPHDSIEGWERAIDAQRRMINALSQLLLPSQDGRDVLMVGHGGVGTLLWCHLAGLPIDRRLDQAPGGGSVWAVGLESRQPVHPWRRIEEM